MNVNDIFPTRFVKAHDLGDKEVTVTIKDATMEDMGHGAEKETKLCLWFEKATKGFVLNKTNAMIIASMYGPETDAWVGKAITIYAARVKAFGTWQDAVRVKEQIPARNVGAARIPDAMQEAPPLDDEEDLLDVDEGQNAPKPTQEAAKPPSGETGHNGTTRQVDASTGEISGDILFTPEPQPKESPPHQRLFGQLTSGFGPDADDVRPWLINKWTTKMTPDNTRNSATELSDDEKDLLADYIKDNLTAVQRAWKNHKAAQAQATTQQPAMAMTA